MGLTDILARKNKKDIAGLTSGIRSVTVVGNELHFEFVNDSTAVMTFTQPPAGPKGDDGVSVVDAEINEEGHLVLTMSDGTEIDSGEVEAESKLTQPLTCTVEIGTITNGKNYPAGTSLEQIIRDMLISYSPPAITLTTSPATKLYDIVTESITAILLKVAVTKKTQNITKIQYFVDSTLLHEETSGVEGGGSFSYQYNPATPIKTDVTFKATATDGKQTSTSTVTIKFVGKSYYGVCDANVSDPDETTVKGGTSVLKDTRTLNYTGITTNWGKVFYAYPKSFGALTYIKDEVNNINYFDSFQRSEVTVDGIDYWCYTLIQPTAAEDNQITFK